MGLFGFLKKKNSSVEEDVLGNSLSDDEPQMPEVFDKSIEEIRELTAYYFLNPPKGVNIRPRQAWRWIDPIEFHSGAITTGRGCYAFFKDGECLYIGKGLGKDGLVQRLKVWLRAEIHARGGKTGVYVINQDQDGVKGCNTFSFIDLGKDWDNSEFISKLEVFLINHINPHRNSHFRTPS